MDTKTIRLAFQSTLPVMTGYMVLGIGFGVLLHDKGYGVFWAFLMSAAIYAGSMQYAALDLISGGAGLVTTALMTVVVNARHFFYGLSMLDRYKSAGREKPYLIFSLTDETYSLLVADPPEGVNLRKYHFFVSLFDHSWWVLGSVLGSLLGSVLPFDTTGMDFAMTALFVVIFTQQWQSVKNHVPALFGLTVSIFWLILLGPSAFVIPAMLTITLLLILFKNRMEEPADGQ